MHLDEEGGNFLGDEAARQQVMHDRLDVRALKAEDYVCAWGDFQRDYFRSLKPACSKNIRSTGHPKFDLLKPAYRDFYAEEASALKTRFGEFILFNMNFSLSNNPLGVADTFSLRSGFYVDAAGRRSEYLGSWSQQMQIVGSMMELIDKISLEFPKISIVIRPHPSEGSNLYTSAFCGRKNIHVIQEGSVPAWILASRVVIHNGCTTGIEAHFGGSEIITYSTSPSEKFDFTLANMVAPVCRDEESVLRRLRKIFSSPRESVPKADNSLFLREGGRNFFNITGDSYAEVVKIFEELQSSMAETAHSYNPSSYVIAETLYRINQFAKLFVRPFFKKKQRQYEYLTGKSIFGGFESSEVQLKAARVGKILGKKFRTEVRSRELIIIEAD